MARAYVYLRPVQMEVGAPVRGRPSYKWVSGRQVVIVASLCGEGLKVGTESTYMRLQEARDYCKKEGYETGLPPLWYVRATTAEKLPKFFSPSNSRLDTKAGAHKMTVVRLEDGRVGVTNGRSHWAWTGDDLERVA